MSPIDAVQVSLERRVDSLEKLLAWWTLLVAVGLMMEYGADLAEWSCGKWKPSKENRGTARFRWMPLFILVGAVFITVGVAGELYVEAGLTVASSDLRTHDSETIAALKLETARLTSENLKLRVVMAGRELTAEQQELIGAALAKYPGKTVWLRSYRADGEAKRLGVEIKHALTLSRITVEDRLEEMYGDGPLLFGIEVTCAENAIRSERSFARAIISTLSAKEIGNLAVLPLSEFGCPSDEITEIHIGIKPPTLPSEPVPPVGVPTRRITPEAIGRIRSALLSFPALQIGASWNVRDNEVDESMRDFVKACCALGTAEWQMSVTLRGAKPGLVGIFVLIRPDADRKTREAARVLASALRAEQLLVDGPREANSMEEFLAPARPQDSSIPNDPIAIVIAKRP